MTRMCYAAWLQEGCKLHVAISLDCSVMTPSSVQRSQIYRCELCRCLGRCPTIPQASSCRTTLPLPLLSALVMSSQRQHSHPRDCEDNGCGWQLAFKRFDCFTHARTDTCAMTYGIFA